MNFLFTLGTWSFSNTMCKHSSKHGLLITQCLFKRHHFRTYSTTPASTRSTGHPRGTTPSTNQSVLRAAVSPASLPTTTTTLRLYAFYRSLSTNNTVRANRVCIPPTTTASDSSTSERKYKSQIDKTKRTITTSRLCSKSVQS